MNQLKTQNSLSPSRPRTILVRSPNWIGDQVLAFPFFHSLRKLHPDAHIAAVCVDWVSSIQYRGLIDEVILLPRARPNLQGGRPTVWHRFLAMEEAAKTLKAKSWDWGILLVPSFSSAWIFWRASVTRVTGYDGQMRRFFLSHALSENRARERHRADAYLGLLEENVPAATGFWREPPPEGEPSLEDPAPFVLEAFDSAKHWDSRQPVSIPVSPYWVLAPGCQAETRRWSIEHFVELGRLIYEKTRLPAVIIGGVQEIALLQSFKGAGFEWVDRVGQGSVADLSMLLSRAQFTVSNDSGLAHVAALCGSRVHVVWGAGDLRRTRPLGPGEVRWSFNPVDCWPCERNRCPLGQGEHLKCLAGIRPEKVFEEMKWLWRR